MNVNNVALETVCGITSKLPENKLPEIAFAGKSNVGKSSLINCLINRKSLARTSSEPGKTQTINFYNVESQLYLVDLPGYGYAKLGKDTVAQWGGMIEKYLKTSKQLQIIFLLVDIRHEPSENDRLMYNFIIKNGYQPVIIATKLDKIKRSEFPAKMKAIKEGLGLPAALPIFPFSAETKVGKEQIWEYIDSALSGN